MDEQEEASLRQMFSNKGTMKTCQQNWLLSSVANQRENNGEASISWTKNSEQSNIELIKSCTFDLCFLTPCCCINQRIWISKSGSKVDFPTLLYSMKKQKNECFNNGAGSTEALLLWASVDSRPLDAVFSLNPFCPSPFKEDQQKHIASDKRIFSTESSLQTNHDTKKQGAFS